MSTLLVDELYSGIVFSQKIKVSRNISLTHLRPWVYLHGTLATGDFQCRVLQGATVLKTQTINYVDINSAKTEAYAHGYIRFDFDSLILNRAQGEESTEYIFEFSMIYHTTDSSNYLGIVREWDASSATVYGAVDMNGDAINDQIEPCGYQIYEYRSY